MTRLLALTMPLGHEVHDTAGCGPGETLLADCPEQTHLLQVRHGKQPAEEHVPQRRSAEDVRGLRTTPITMMRARSIISLAGQPE